MHHSILELLVQKKKKSKHTHHLLLFSVAEFRLPVAEFPFLEDVDMVVGAIAFCMLDKHPATELPPGTA